MSTHKKRSVTVV